MRPFRKTFFGDPLFPFDIIYKDKKSPQRELPDHLHDRYELVYVYTGKGTFFIDDTFYEMLPGDLFVIPGNTIHRAHPDERDPVLSTAVFFAPAFAQGESSDDAYSDLRCFEIARKRKRYKIELPSPLSTLTESALEQMEGEVRHRKTGYREAARLHLRLLLLQLNRCAAPDLNGNAAATADVRFGPSWMKDALRAIDEHPDRRATLSELAERVSVTPPHFSRVFKKLTGMNVTDYVNAKRIVKAKEMLRGSEESVGEIAERCGFDSLPHFHRVFKSLTGTTPAAFRREHEAGERC